MLFYLAAFIYIFLLFNREFVPLIDLRYLNFSFFIILLLNKFFYFLKNKYITIIGDKYTVIIFTCLVILLFVSNVNWLTNPYEPDIEVLLSTIVLYSYNILAIIVFALYWQRFNIKVFKFYFLFGGFILFLSLLLQFLGIESLPFEGEIRSGKVEEEAFIFGMRYGGYAEDQNYATIGMVIWIFTGFKFFSKSIIKYVILAFGVLGILLSFSKTIIAVIIILLFYYVSKNVKIQFIYIITLLAFIFTVFGLVFDFLMSLPTIYLRVSMWKAAFYGFLDSPIFGNGISSVRSNFLYRGGWYVQPHNSFLAILVDHGILGFIFFLLLIIRSFNTRDVFYKYLLIVFLAFSCTYELFVFQYPYFIIGILPMILNHNLGDSNYVNFKLNTQNESFFSC